MMSRQRQVDRVGPFRRSSKGMEALQKAIQASEAMQATLDAARKQAREEKRRIRLVAGWLRRPGLN